jgi:hypothetical protein
MSGITTETARFGRAITVQDTGGARVVAESPGY